MKKSSKGSRLPRVSIIIVSFNTKKLLKRCLASIFADRACRTWEIIVVDNGSIDGSVGIVKKDFPAVHLIENSANIGFSRAENQGLRRSNGQFVLFLNSDTKVGLGTVDTLADYLEEHSDVGLVAPKLLNPDRTVQPSCFYFPGIINALRAYWFGDKRLVEKRFPSGKVPVSVDATVAAAMMLPVEVARKLGGFDEKFFFYFEDIDLCKRVRDLGLNVIYYPSAEVVHHHGASGRSGAGFGYLKESLLYPIKKAIGRWQQDSTQAYLAESSIVYFGWIRHLLITLIIRFAKR